MEIDEARENGGITAVGDFHFWGELQDLLMRQDGADYSSIDHHNRVFDRCASTAIDEGLRFERPHWSSLLLGPAAVSATLVAGPSLLNTYISADRGTVSTFKGS
jgi:hypothetical protein